jgi:D-arginine dehydrogenase
VHALHQGFLRGVRAASARLLCHAEVQAIVREQAAQQWQVRHLPG